MFKHKSLATGIYKKKAVFKKLNREMIYFICASSSTDALMRESESEKENVKNLTVTEILFSHHFNNYIT